MVPFGEIAAAREALGPVLRPTPTEPSEALSRVAGRPVLLKPEQRQRTGSFKIRGAYTFLHSLTAPAEVVAASAGNHAQGVALAASLTGHRAVIYMPVSAALPKVEATRAYGAEVRFAGEVVDDAIAAAVAHAAATGAVFVPPFDDPRIIAGQGTVGLELAEEAPGAEVAVVAVGGGGLIAGVATALAKRRPGMKVIGVEAAGAASMTAALAAGGPVAVGPLATMADGIAIRTVSPLTLDHVRAYVDAVVTVSEEEISRAVLLLLERAKAVVEPAGAAALAAVLAGRIPGTGPVAVVLSGGNVDPLLLVKLIDHGLSAAGRYVRLRIVLADHPGSLAGLMTLVADLGLNVLDVEHHRAGVTLDVDQVEVLLTLETRDPEHRSDIVDTLTAAGLRVSLG